MHPPFGVGNVVGASLILSITPSTALFESVSANWIASFVCILSPRWKNGFQQVLRLWSDRRYATFPGRFNDDRGGRTHYPRAMQVVDHAHDEMVRHIDANNRIRYPLPVVLAEGNHSRLAVHLAHCHSPRDC